MKVAKKIILIPYMFFLIAGCHVKNIDVPEMKPKIEVATCGFDDDDKNYFCRPEQKKIFENNLNKQADFNKEYSVIKIKDREYYRVVLLNQNNKTVYPLYQKLVNNKKLKFKYSINSDKLCISGDFEAYRDSYSNSEICFKLVDKNIEKDTIREISDLPDVKEISVPIDINDYETCSKTKSQKICEKYVSQKYNTYTREKVVKIIPQFKSLDEKYQNFDFIKGKNNLYVILTDPIGLDSGEILSYYTLVMLSDDFKKIVLGDWFKISQEKKLEYKDESGRIRAIQLD